jgi:hypothetical protein
MSSACREMQVQVTCQDRTMVCCAIQLTAAVRLAPALSQSVDSFDAVQFRVYESNQQNWIFLIKTRTVQICGHKMRRRYQIGTKFSF